MSLTKSHHEQLELCTTRPAYRQGRKLTAVKVYTINQESQHLYIYGVPSLKLHHELKTKCLRYGKVASIAVVEDANNVPFTECYHIEYSRIQSARIAKRLLDAISFYGGILHVCYAPECETVSQTKAKLLQRKKDVLLRLPKSENETT
ncbi:RNA-binding protein 48 [Diabrotica virgifera virgifera]|uniref:RNA-binding protein 48-like n=1 Tax=Diabrotica virgifera virgifera TaxID=50390 RepID=A0A6P7FLJ6_DIAVI|nr:RNA-binding protein 48 [Diabrotica virgifera virgifera]